MKTKYIPKEFTIDEIKEMAKTGPTIKTKGTKMAEKTRAATNKLTKADRKALAELSSDLIEDSTTEGTIKALKCLLRTYKKYHPEDMIW